MEDFELLLFDRINVIKDTINKYGEDKFYISFSGGKDSTILHHLIDMALPDNKIPRVFIDTGIEYNDIRMFVYQKALYDNRFIILKPHTPIKQMLESQGYPFKSKEHSLRVAYFNKRSNAKYIQKYIHGEVDGKKTTFCCPAKLKYQFEEVGKYNYSNRCCYELKKIPVQKWQKENNKQIVITGMKREEGGNRKNIKGCVLTDKNGNVIKFHPLLVVSEEFENYVIQKFNIQLCRLYYPPFNFKRTGCKGCPYNTKLRDQLETMKKLLPNEYQQCCIIWKPVYDEYKRIGYRLKKEVIK